MGADITGKKHAIVFKYKPGSSGLPRTTTNFSADSSSRFLNVEHKIDRHGGRSWERERPLDMPHDDDDVKVKVEVKVEVMVRVEYCLTAIITFYCHVISCALARSGVRRGAQ